MAALFKGLLSIETLAEMPLPFVHILRDERIKQLEAKKRQSEIMANRMSNNFDKPSPASNNAEAGSGFDESAIEDIVEGFT
jgi:hypothetical protein